jgi:AAT family amino acid transporter
LYMATRMIFSLARGGYAPPVLGRVSQRGTPMPALLSSAAGLAVALLLSIVLPKSAYVYMFGVSLFGALFAWVLIFMTHLQFRRHTRGDNLRHFLPLFPATTILGMLAIVAILISTWWVQGMRVALQSGIPWLLLITLVYYAWGRKRGVYAATRGSRPNSEAPG